MSATSPPPPTDKTAMPSPSEADPTGEAVSDAPAHERRQVSDWLARLWWSWPLAAFVVIAVTGEYAGLRAAAVTTGLIVAVGGSLTVRLLTSRTALVAVFLTSAVAYFLVLARSPSQAPTPEPPRSSISELARSGQAVPHDLRGVALNGAVLAGAALAGRNMAGVDAQGTNLAGADLSEANLAGADLSGANLRGANLKRACLRGADLTGASLDGADFTGADVTHVTGLARPPTNVIGWASVPARGQCQ
jgi:hypothetical protein